MFVPNVACYAC